MILFFQGLALALGLFGSFGGDFVHFGGGAPTGAPMASPGDGGGSMPGSGGGLHGRTESGG